jgi:hypothetical protein
LRNNLLIAVGQANVEPWITICSEGQEKTWINNSVDGTEVIHSKSKITPVIIQQIDKFHEKNRYKKWVGLWQGRYDKVGTKIISKKIAKYSFNSENRTLTVDSWSTYQLSGRRFIALYDWFLSQTDYNFLFTTTTSSYINKKKLFDLIQKFNCKDLIYAGYLLPENHTNQFVSGAGTLLSRSCVEVLVQNWRRFKFDTLEDVSRGDLMRELGVPPIPLTRVDVPNVDSVKALPIDVLEREFHYRCKSPEVPRQDVRIMQKLHERLISL